jgi:hypothetical protein
VAPDVALIGLPSVIEHEAVRVIAETRMKDRRTTLPPKSPAKSSASPTAGRPKATPIIFMQCPGGGEWIDA